MIRSAQIIDDFYDNPLEVRKKALTLEYVTPESKYYHPGRNSSSRILPHGSDEMFSQILQEPVVGAKGLYHGHTRISLAGDRRLGDVHIDPKCSWAGIIYLTLDKDAQGGTEFFRNRQYGTDRAPLTDEEAQLVYGMKTKGDVVEQLIDVEGKDRSRWEHVMTLPMKFNRCVLFRPWMWHTSGIDFGDTPENGRLVQLLFFMPPEGAGRVTAPGG